LLARWWIDGAGGRCAYSPSSGGPLLSVVTPKAVPGTCVPAHLRPRRVPFSPWPPIKRCRDSGTAFPSAGGFRPSRLSDEPCRELTTSPVWESAGRGMSCNRTAAPGVVMRRARNRTGRHHRMATTTPDSRSQGVGFRSERGPVLAALMLCTGLVALDSTIIATAVPSIVRDLGGSRSFPGCSRSTC